MNNESDPQVVKATVKVVADEKLEEQVKAQSEESESKDIETLIAKEKNDG